MSDPLVMQALAKLVAMVSGRSSRVRSSDQTSISRKSSSI